MALARTVLYRAIRFTTTEQERQYCILHYLNTRTPRDNRVLTVSGQLKRVRSMAEGTSFDNPSGNGAILSGREDHYQGFIVDSSSIPLRGDATEFGRLLDASLARWRECKYRGIWLKLLRTDHAHYIPLACERGFEFHHAESEYLMMTKWLPVDNPSTLPPNASHQVGVGVFIYDEKSNKVLAVQERNGPLKGKDVWKMPTGLVNVGEDITEAAVREVHEETGCDVSFSSILALRQSHGFAFGKSDLFFVIACVPILPEGAETIDDIVLCPQESEIEKCQWMPLESFCNVEFMQSRPLYRQIMNTCYAYAKGGYKGISGAKLAANADREDLFMFGEALVDERSKEQREDSTWMGI